VKIEPNSPSIARLRSPALFRYIPSTKLTAMVSWLSALLACAQTDADPLVLERLSLNLFALAAHTYQWMRCLEGPLCATWMSVCTARKESHPSTACRLRFSSLGVITDGVCVKITCTTFGRRCGRLTVRAVAAACLAAGVQCYLIFPSRLGFVTVSALKWCGKVHHWLGRVWQVA
jgi:hypothetical protein